MNVTVTPAALPSSTVTKVINPLSTSQVATFEDSYHRRLAYSTGAFNASALHLARQARLLLCQKDAGVSIWRIKEKDPQAGNEDVEESAPPSLGGWEPVLDMDLTVHTNLVTSAISDDGKWVIVSDWYESKLFRVQRLVRHTSTTIFDQTNNTPTGQRGPKTQAGQKLYLRLTIRPPFQYRIHRRVSRRLHPRRNKACHGVCYVRPRHYH